MIVTNQHRYTGHGNAHRSSPSHRDDPVDGRLSGANPGGTILLVGNDADIVVARPNGWPWSDRQLDWHWIRLLQCRANRVDADAVGFERDWQGGTGANGSRRRLLCVMP